MRGKCLYANVGGCVYERVVCVSLLKLNAGTALLPHAHADKREEQRPEEGVLCLASLSDVRRAHRSECDALTSTTL